MKKNYKTEEEKFRNHKGIIFYPNILKLSAVNFWIQQEKLETALQ